MIDVINVFEFRWFIVRVAPAAEMRAQAYLSQRGIASFLPTVRAWRRRRASRARVAQAVSRPLIEGYVFIGATDIGAAFKTLFEAGMVRGVICQDGAPYELKPEEILSLNLTAARRAADGKRTRTPIEFKVGDLVRIVEGPAAGYITPVKRIAWPRAQVEIDILGATRLVDVPVDALRVSV